MNYHLSKFWVEMCINWHYYIDLYTRGYKAQHSILMGGEFMSIGVMTHTCLGKREEKYASNITCFTKPPQPATAALENKTVIGFKYKCVSITYLKHDTL